LNWSFRRGGLEFSYAETPTTTGLNNYNQGNLINPEEPNDYLAFPGSSERYISKRGQAGLSLEFRQTTLRLGAYDELRTGRYTSDGTPLNDESQAGVSILIDWSPGPRTEVIAAGSVSSVKNEAGDEADYITGRLSASYRLGNAVALSLAYFYDEQDPKARSAGPNYVSNVIVFYVSYSF